MEKVAKVAEVGNATPAHPAQNENQHQDEEDWELFVNGLPEGSNLSGNKALLEITPRMRHTLRRPKRPTLAKGRKAAPRPRNDGEHKTEGAR